jgi:hypothetical protein
MDNPTVRLYLQLFVEEIMLFMIVCELWCPTHIVLSFCFVFLRLVASISGLSIFIASLVFSNVYLLCAQCSVFFADPFTNIQDEYFVGASDLEEEGTWTWITNQSSSYMVFREGQPNNFISKWICKKYRAL